MGSVIQPDHYGGTENFYETIKVEEAKGLVDDHYTATAWEYMSRWRDKNGAEDLCKAVWWIYRRICREVNGTTSDGVTILFEKDEQFLALLVAKQKEAS